MGVDIPDGARIVLFQEDKFKNYHNELHWALSEYDKVVSKVIPVTAMVLRPHFRDMEYKLRPGMIMLTWTSMNIDAYKSHIHAGLRKLEELVVNINDIIEIYVVGINNNYMLLNTCRRPCHLKKYCPFSQVIKSASLRQRDGWRRPKRPMRFGIAEITW